MKRMTKKKIWAGIALLIILILWFKWDNWFYNPVEPPYQASINPSRILLTCSGNLSDSRDITWEGDTLTKRGLLQLASKSFQSDTILFTSKPNIIRTSGGASAFFRIRIENLGSDQTYSYRVSNDNRWSEWNEFKITNKTDSTYSFIYLGDVQDSINGVAGNLLQAASLTRPNASFVLYVGDMIERPHDAYWGEWFRSGGRLFRSLPVIATPGNHEYYKGIIQKLDPRWTSHLTLPQNGPPNFLGRACYWDYKQTRFISIDSNGIQSISSALEQRDWLKSILEQTHQKWVIVFMHHPLYSTSRGRDYFYLRTLFKSLFDQYHVDLVLAGHDHSYGRAIHIPTTLQNHKQGPVYIVTHASPKLYDINFSDKMDKMASNTAMFQLFDINNDSIQFGAYTPKGDTFDRFTIHKDGLGNSTVTQHAPPNETQFLLPTANFIKKSSTGEIKRYKLEMQAWEKSKK
jgi:Calcineurin-like phosphoesterase/Purple acid Phosphatase, N-terminal domain